MVYIMKDWEKKKVMQKFIDETLERNYRSYEAVKEAEKKLKDSVMERMKELGIKDIEKMELRSPSDVIVNGSQGADFSIIPNKDAVVNVNVDKEGRVIGKETIIKK